MDGEGKLRELFYFPQDTDWEDVTKQTKVELGGGTKEEGNIDC